MERFEHCENYKPSSSFPLLPADTLASGRTPSLHTSSGRVRSFPVTAAADPYVYTVRVR